jgi:hypothetical protein
VDCSRVLKQRMNAYFLSSRIPSTHLLVRSFLIAGFLSIFLPKIQSQAPPQVVSVTPADGATGVATNSAVVFLFDQDMKTAVFPFGSLPPTLIGNFQFEPPNLFFNGTWATDKRTLTFKSNRGMPYDTIVSWTLNPVGGTNFPQFSSASGELLPTVSGNFRTAAYVPPIPPPKAISISPTNGAREIALQAPLVLTFDQEMDTNIVLQASTNQFIGNYSISPSSVSALFVGSWSADKRTLTFTPSARLPFGTAVYWAINPAGTATPLQNSTGQLLAQISGNYQIITDTGGNPSENCLPPSITGGSYTLTKILQHVQTNANQVSSSDSALSTFTVTVKSPPSGKGGTKTRSGGGVTNVSITLPGNQEKILTQVSGLFEFSDSLAEPGLEAAYPPGAYTLRIETDGSPEATVSLNVPATPASVPEVLNFTEAQTIDPVQDFTLRYSDFSPQPPGAFIQVQVTDEFGKMIFQAPNTCVSRPLNPSDNSVVIPAHYLRAGLNYHGTLRFGSTFYTSSTDLAQMTGSGVIQRATSFLIGTTGSSGVITQPSPPRFIAYRLLTGTVPELTISGTPSRTYAILRTSSLMQPAWTQVGTVTINSGGTGVFQDGGSRRGGSPGFPAFYRALLQ